VSGPQLTARACAAKQARTWVQQMRTQPPPRPCVQRRRSGCRSSTRRRAARSWPPRRAARCSRSAQGAASCQAPAARA
jgi:hypothetical protein